MLTAAAQACVVDVGAGVVGEHLIAGRTAAWKSMNMNSSGGFSVNSGGGNDGKRLRTLAGPKLQADDEFWRSLTLKARAQPFSNLLPPSAWPLLLPPSTPSPAFSRLLSPSLTLSHLRSRRRAKPPPTRGKPLCPPRQTKTRPPTRQRRMLPTQAGQLRRRVMPLQSCPSWWRVRRTRRSGSGWRSKPSSRGLLRSSSSRRRRAPPEVGLLPTACHLLLPASHLLSPTACCFLHPAACF